MRALLLLLVGLAACITPAKSFPCATDGDCSGGHCEPGTNFCSFSDTDCPGGSRYGDAAGELSNTCVGGDIPVNCGNGVVDPDEDCDDNTELCVDCKRPRCGDGKVFAGIEECDDGNTMDGDACPGNCLMCPAGSVTNPVNSHCYWVIETARDWTAAGTDCAASHGYLAAIEDDAENTFVHGLTTTATDYWIGITFETFGTPPPTSGFYREDGFVATFQPWTAGQPTAGLNCGAMAQATGTWSSQDCSTATLHPYVCERSPWTVSIDTKRAYLSVTGRQRQVYATAKAACPMLPGAPHLVTITDAAEKSLIDGITSASQVWIGLDDLATPGTFAWITGEPLSLNGFGTGFPTATAGEDCGALRFDDTWMNRTCTPSTRGYICELEFP